MGTLGSADRDRPDRTHRDLLLGILSNGDERLDLGILRERLRALVQVAVRRAHGAQEAGRIAGAEELFGVVVSTLAAELRGVRERLSSPELPNSVIDANTRSFSSSAALGDIGRTSFCRSVLSSRPWSVLIVPAAREPVEVACETAMGATRAMPRT